MKFCNYQRVSITLAALLCLCVAQTALAKDIKIGHLTYHTGEYGGFGEFFDAVADFTIEEINNLPPLNREITVIHEDIGTIGEARAARKLMGKDKVDVLLNAAHNYESYRSSVLKRIKVLKAPLLPSVHGGAISSELGGNAREPLFRGSPMDTAQSAAALLHAKNSGFNSIVIVHTTLDGHVAQKSAALKSAERLGISVKNVVEIQTDWTDYSTIASQVENHKADAVVMFTAPNNGGLFLRNSAQMGYSWHVIGTSEWQESDFVALATSDALASHKSVVFTANSHTEGPAWDHYYNKITNAAQFDRIGDPSNSYATQYYDLLVVTALAIEKSGKINAKKWSKAMYEVTNDQGETVHSYEQGIKALRAGKEINYDGVTGSMEYTNTGVVAGHFGIFRWSTDGKIMLVTEADGKQVAELDQ
jgi:ABC-type branched-subunit amino acid transport system substrate-binding protein